MIDIFFKRSQDGSLSLILTRSGERYVIMFDSIKFFLQKRELINFTDYDHLATKYHLQSLDEIRSEDFDVFYLKMNGGIIFQISWIQNGNNIIQQLGIYDMKMTSKVPVLGKTVYESALDRLNSAEVYEDLVPPFWG